MSVWTRLVVVKLCNAANVELYSTCCYVLFEYRLTWLYQVVGFLLRHRWCEGALRYVCATSVSSGQHLLLLTDVLPLIFTNRLWRDQRYLRCLCEHLVMLLTILGCYVVTTQFQDVPLQTSLLRR